MGNFNPIYILFDPLEVRPICCDKGYSSLHSAATFVTSARSFHSLSRRLAASFTPFFQHPAIKKPSCTSPLVHSWPDIVLLFLSSLELFYTFHKITSPTPTLSCSSKDQKLKLKKDVPLILFHHSFKLFAYYPLIYCESL